MTAESAAAAPFTYAALRQLRRGGPPTGSRICSSPDLEEAGRRVVLDQDLPPGGSRSRSASRAVAASRKTVLVVSRSFLDGRWAPLEEAGHPRARPSGAQAAAGAGPPRRLRGAAARPPAGGRRPARRRQPAPVEAPWPTPSTRRPATAAASSSASACASPRRPPTSTARPGTAPAPAGWPSSTWGWERWRRCSTCWLAGARCGLAGGGVAGAHPRPGGAGLARGPRPLPPPQPRRRRLPLLPRRRGRRCRRWPGRCLVAWRGAGGARPACGPLGCRQAGRPPHRPRLRGVGRRLPRPSSSAGRAAPGARWK